MLYVDGTFTILSRDIVNISLHLDGQTSTMHFTMETETEILKTRFPKTLPENVWQSYLRSIIK